VRPERSRWQRCTSTARRLVQSSLTHRQPRPSEVFTKRFPEDGRTCLAMLLRLHHGEEKWRRRGVEFIVGVGGTLTMGGEEVEELSSLVLHIEGRLRDALPHKKKDGEMPAA
jgi:hypothetical protein